MHGGPPRGWADRVGEVDAEPVERGLELRLDRVRALAEGRGDLVDRRGRRSSAGRPRRASGRAGRRCRRAGRRRVELSAPRSPAAARSGTTSSRTTRPDRAAHAEGVVRGDREEPGAQGTVVADAAAALEGCQERLDDDVLGLGPVAQDQVRDALQLAPVGLEQVPERLGSTPAQGLDGHRFHPSDPLGAAIGRPLRRIDARARSFRASGGARWHHQHVTAFDLLLRGGTVIDGTGSPGPSRRRRGPRRPDPRGRRPVGGR